jgi:hypothetical protein
MGLRQQQLINAARSNGIESSFLLNGAPTNGASGSFVSKALIGSQLVDVASGKLYIATAAGSSVTWTLVGSQT